MYGARSFLYLTPLLFFYFFFFNDTATTEIYTLSLHDALPICIGILTVSDLGAVGQRADTSGDAIVAWAGERGYEVVVRRDRKSTRLNSSHSQISYAVFCLKKKKKKKRHGVYEDQT